ncbi:MAG TPA: sigma-70 family RNA polymerase sigma factor [Bryobacteraceae bacterium]|nr:sigma-70 family RNA polymerase sigma factor [Bryobacteraceae bacterium]
MKTSVELKGFENKSGAERTDELRRLIAKQIARLERKAKSLDPAIVSSRIVVERIAAHHLYKISATLDVPGKLLAAGHEARDPTTAVRKSVSELERQFEEHKAKVRGEHIWKRVARRQEIGPRQTATPSNSYDHDSFFALVSPHLSALHDFVQHVLEFAEARGDLRRDQLTHDDVVDEALLRAYSEAADERSRKDVRAWIFELAEEQIQKEIRRTKWERHHTISVEADIRETPPMEEVSTMGEEVLDFYQPDGDLKLEDILPELEMDSPEEDTAREELRECVREALNSMPRPWRRAVLGYHVEGLTGIELAQAVTRPQQEVERILEYARGYMRERLVEAGCTFSPSKVNV